MKVTDEEIAKALDKDIGEIEELKENNRSAYEVLAFGVLCRKLSLTQEDLEKFHQQLAKEEAKEK
ncbi:hypothetical protein D3C81_2031870 [compost metagenome]